MSIIKMLPKDRACEFAHLGAEQLVGYYMMDPETLGVCRVHGLRLVVKKCPNCFCFLYGHPRRDQIYHDASCRRLKNPFAPDAKPRTSHYYLPRGRKTLITPTTPLNSPIWQMAWYGWRPSQGSKVPRNEREAEARRGTFRELFRI